MICRAVPSSLGLSEDPAGGSGLSCGLSSVLMFMSGATSTAVLMSIDTRESESERERLTSRETTKKKIHWCLLQHKKSKTVHELLLINF